MQVRIDTTIATAMRGLGIDPLDLVSSAQRIGDQIYPSDQHERELDEKLDGVFLDEIDGVLTIHGGSIALTGAKSKGRAEIMFNGAWDDDEDFASNRVDGMIPSHINGVGVFPDERTMGLIGKPVSALGDLVRGDLSPIADRVIRDIRNKDYRPEGGGLIYQIELTPSYEMLKASAPAA